MHDLRRLRAFLATAEHGSFSGAATELGYAQSVVSHHIAALEQELGVVLIDRGIRPVTITEAGRRLRVYAIAIFEQVSDAEADLRAIAGLRSGTLRIGAFLAACVSFMPLAVSRFRAAIPDVEVHLEQLGSDEALERVRTGALDLAVIWRADGADMAAGDGFDHEILAEDAYRIVLPAGHRLARRAGLTLAELANEPFTVPRDQGDGAGYNQWLREVCSDAGFEPRDQFPVDDVSVGIAFIKSGLCVGLIPQLTLPNHEPAIVARPLPGHRGFRSVIACWRGGRRIPTVHPMLDCLRGATAETMQLASTG